MQLSRFLPPFVPLIGGIVSGFIRSSDWKSWYSRLHKAPWNPPGWVFGPVWTALYLSMGFAYFLVANSESSKKDHAKFLFWVQLGLNFLWSPLFFGFKAPTVALVLIAGLWWAIAVTVKSFKEIDERAAKFMIPYWIWVTYAATLNLYIVLAN